LPEPTPRGWAAFIPEIRRGPIPAVPGCQQPPLTSLEQHLLGTMLHRTGYSRANVTLCRFGKGPWAESEAEAGFRIRSALSELGKRGLENEWTRPEIRRGHTPEGDEAIREGDAAIREGGEAAQEPARASPPQDATEPSTNDTSRDETLREPDATAAVTRYRPGRTRTTAAATRRGRAERERGRARDEADRSSPRGASAERNGPGAEVSQGSAGRICDRPDDERGSRIESGRAPRSQGMSPERHGSRNRTRPGPETGGRGRPGGRGLEGGLGSARRCEAGPGSGRKDRIETNQGAVTRIGLLIEH
jgi:hypothetical protein